MKCNKWIIGLAAIGLMVCATAVRAQDFFEGTRTYVLSAPQNFVLGVNTVTNGPLDHVKFEGRATINFLTTTNTGAAAGTLTAQVFTSPDGTNMTALANYALITGSTTDAITNFWSYGGSNIVNNAVLLPGTATTPSTVASSGFATPYLASLPFTNSGAITLNGTANKNVQIGFNIDTLQRYIYVVYTVGGTATNFTSAALLSGFTKF